jgi:hypothetical protein
MGLPAPEDLRGMTVRDRHGLIAGRVDDLYVDRAGAVRYLGVRAGRRVPGQVLVPLDEVTAIRDAFDTELRAPYSGGLLRDAPALADDAIPSRALEGRVHHHFGREPYWQSGGAPAGVAGIELVGVPEDERVRRWGT